MRETQKTPGVPFGASGVLCLYTIFKRSYGPVPCGRFSFLSFV
nr:MAG TPA: hypothetical protein [Caudoviricetes sp.]